MSKSLGKAFMHRSKFKNFYNKYRAENNWVNHEKQRNFCVSPLRKTKDEYFQKLNVKGLSGNRKFWKTIKPFFMYQRFNHQRTNGERKQPTWYRGKRISYFNEYLFRKHKIEFSSKEG